METLSLDQLFLSDRKSAFVIKLTGKRPRLGLNPGDKIIVNRALPFQVGRPALVVINGKFRVEIVTQEFMDDHEPDSGDFIWGMVQTVIKELA